MKKLSSNQQILELSDEELIGYNWIRSQGEASTKEYTLHFGVAQRTASRHFAKMLELGLIETNGESSKSPKLKYMAKE